MRHFHPLPALSFAQHFTCAVFSLTLLCWPFFFLFLKFHSTEEKKKPLLLPCGLCLLLPSFVTVYHVILTHHSLFLFAYVTYLFSQDKGPAKSLAAVLASLVFPTILYLPSSLFSVFFSPIPCSSHGLCTRRAWLQVLLAFRFVICDCLWFTGSLFLFSFYSLSYAFDMLRLLILPLGFFTLGAFWLFSVTVLRPLFFLLCTLWLNIFFLFAWGPTHRSHGFHTFLPVLLFLILCNKAPLSTLLPCLSCTSP